MHERNEMVERPGRACYFLMTDVAGPVIPDGNINQTYFDSRAGAAAEIDPRF